MNWPIKPDVSCKHLPLEWFHVLFFFYLLHVWIETQHFGDDGCVVKLESVIYIEEILNVLYTTPYLYIYISRFFFFFSYRCVDPIKREDVIRIKIEIKEAFLSSFFLFSRFCLIKLIITAGQNGWISKRERERKGKQIWISIRIVSL